MRDCRIAEIAGIAGLVLIWPTIVGAQTDFEKCGADAVGHFVERAEFYIDNCAGASSHLDTTRLFTERIETSQGDARIAAIGDALTLMDSLLTEMETDIPTLNSDAGAAFRLAIDCDRQSIGPAVDPDQCEDTAAQVSTLAGGKWEPVLFEGPVFTETVFETLQAVDTVCPASEPGDIAACDTTFAGILPVLELHSLVRSQIVPTTNNEPAREIVRFYASSHERWKSYLSDTGFQYPWELGWNKARNGGFQEIARHRDAPTSRIIALHPTIGLYYSGDASDGNKADLVGIVKIFGYKRWRFDQETNRAKNVWDWYGGDGGCHDL